MGKFLEKFKKSSEGVKNIARNMDDNINDYYNKKPKNPKQFNSRIKERTPEGISDDLYEDIDEDIDDYNPNYQGDYDDYGVGIQPAQKPESFHHFILENQYKDLEKSIRGYKDVFNKEKNEWEIKRKKAHCFTDEEAEEILRLAQSLLATDIKLSFINKEVFGLKAMSLYKRLRQLFREIAEYRYGRYSHDVKEGSKTYGQVLPGGHAIEQAMKLQNLKIFVELTERIVANYSRAIAGMENKLTHQSVRGQESLQSSDRLNDFNNMRYS